VPKRSCARTRSGTRASGYSWMRARARAKRSRRARRPRLHNERRSLIIESSGPRNCHSFDRVFDPTTFVQFQPPGTDSEQSRACSPVKGDWTSRDFGIDYRPGALSKTESSPARRSFTRAILRSRERRGGGNTTLESRTCRANVYKLISCFSSAT